MYRPLAAPDTPHRNSSNTCNTAQNSKTKKDPKMKKDPVADCVSVRPPPFIGRQKSPSRSWPQRLQTHRRRSSRLNSGHSNQVPMLSRKGNARRLIFSVACGPRSSGSKHPFSSYQLHGSYEKKKKSFMPPVVITYPLYAAFISWRA